MSRKDKCPSPGKQSAPARGRKNRGFDWQRRFSSQQKALTRLDDKPWSFTNDAPWIFSGDAPLHFFENNLLLKNKNFLNPTIPEGSYPALCGSVFQLKNKIFTPDDAP